MTRAFSAGADISGASFVLYFGDRKIISSPAVFETLQALCPKAEILGCSTGTVVEGATLHDRAATAVAVRLDHSRVRLAHVLMTDGDSHAAGMQLAEQLRGPDLAGLLILSDGLTVNGSALIRGVQSVLGAGLPIGGGLAGDGPDFEQTLVSVKGMPLSGQVAALAFYGAATRINVGVGHGWEHFGPRRRITRAQGTTLYELDGKPALDLYKRYLGEEASDLPASALLYPLMITNPENPSDEVIRTILSIDHDANSMTFAGDMPEGWSARLMHGAFNKLVDGAAEAARLSIPQDGPEHGGLAVLVSCVGRRLALDQRTGDEVEAVAAGLPPHFLQTGFYSYGEIASQGAGRCSLHNETMTVMTLAEAA